MLADRRGEKGRVRYGGSAKEGVTTISLSAKEGVTAISLSAKEGVAAWERRRVEGGPRMKECWVKAWK